MADTTSARDRKKPRRLRAALIIAGLVAVVGAGAADWGWGQATYRYYFPSIQVSK
ncbi:hypothetical protein [Kitasatospora sp. NPDC085879]|uniref:hypothetical protein n=1 Tax=Kitasatospora sp. NPDC085879 TaxID=3154769 RepID=UPI00344A0C07